MQQFLVGSVQRLRDQFSPSKLQALGRDRWFLSISTPFGSIFRFPGGVMEAAQRAEVYAYPGARHITWAQTVHHDDSIKPGLGGLPDPIAMLRRLVAVEDILRGHHVQIDRLEKDSMQVTRDIARCDARLTAYLEDAHRRRDRAEEQSTDLKILQSEIVVLQREMKALKQGVDWVFSGAGHGRNFRAILCE
jgi:hypothetical protein